jgi:transcriptional regulator with XRE-family HTH domain
MDQKALRPGEVFGRRVREARDALGWTQQQLADRLREIGRETDRATVARVEQGKTLAALDMVIAIAAALHVPPVHLLVPLSEEETVAITPKLTVDAPAARAWIRGVGLLPGEELLDVWPHLPESEKRAYHRAPPADPKEGLLLLLAGWFADEAVAKRVAATDEAADSKRKEEKNDG